MKILIAYGSKGKYFHLKEFGDALEKLGVEYRLVKDSDYSKGFPSKNISDWFFGKRKFKDLIKEFSPDAIFVDRQTHFGIHAIQEKIPLFVLLRGHYWSELEWAKKTIHKGLMVRIILWFRNRITENCFKGATSIFPICAYLENVVIKHHPNKKTHVFFEGVNQSRWFKDESMDLNHPNVGLLQDANWWGKTKEMLTLTKVLEKLPNVTFYWAGDGPYREKILATLNKYDNFKWLGRLDYPDKVRNYLSGIDIYALVSGMDLAPLTLKEAELMEKPVLATDAGGISEMMDNKKSGFLIKEGDHDNWVEKIKFFLENKEKAKEMGLYGREFVIENFDWNVIAKRFLDFAEKDLQKSN